MRAREAIAAVLLLASTTFAWPPRLEDALNAVKREAAPLVQRQATSTSYNLDYTGVQGNTATTVSSTDSASSSTTTGSDATITNTPSQTGSNDGSSNTGNATSTASKSGAAQNTSTISINPQAPAGGISLITPGAQTTSYYKVADWVTFAWNYTSLSVTPSAVDILASCARNQATYTIALNQSIPTSGPQTVLWDTGSYQANATQPLLTETYTLIIHDAAQPVSATAQPGMLGTYNQFTFGMYVPLPGGQDLTGFKCVTCSGAMTSIEKQTMTAVFGMACLTVMSFTWFAGVAGLW